MIITKSSLALGILNIRNDTPILPFDFINSFYKMPWFAAQRYFRRISHQKIKKTRYIILLISLFFGI